MAGGREDDITPGRLGWASGSPPRARILRRRAEFPDVATTVARAHTGSAGGDTVLGRYRLGRRLGAGGFGAVHEALDERLDRWVAVKVIPSDGPAPERGRREALAAARLDHPSIVAVYDAGEDDEARYLISELVEGRTLAQLERDDALSDRDVLRIGLALADALVHAHERGVVHRDVKPQNVMVPDEPRSWREVAKLTDFGIAMLADDVPLTMTGDIVGTLAYMAPEQAAGQRVDERADIYSLALVLYEALAGVNPMRAPSPAETARRVGTRVPPLSDVRPDLPLDLTDAIERALDIDPELRGDLDDLADALADALPRASDEGSEATIVMHPLERRGLPQGAPRFISAAAAALLAGVVLLALSPGPAAPWPMAALVAGALVALLPRAGWIAMAIGLPLALTLGTAPRPGSALLVALALLPVPLLLRRAPVAWTAPAAAPLLGVAALAGAFPALAGRLPRWHERAALGLLGAWWLVLAEPLAERTLLLGADTPSRAAFDGALSLTAAEVVGPVASSGALLIGLVWAVAAALMPWLIRNRSLALDVIAAAAWAGALGAATMSVGEWLGETPRGAVAGAIAAGVIALWPVHRE